MLPLRKVRPLEIPLPADWPKHAKAALVSAAGILHYVLTYVHGWASTSPLADVRVRAERDRLEAELGLLREELRIKDARIAQLEEPTKPHFLPHLRLAVLILQAGRAWSAAQTARCFGLAPSTVLSWQRRLREEGEDRLIAPREAFNRYPDFVRDIVHVVKRVVHGAGARRVADLLAKASLHVSATTVRRKLDTGELIPPVPPTVLDDATQKVERAAEARTVAARYPHHVWGIDFTTVAIAGGRWAGCLAKILPQSWPFCWWITVVVDYHSRAALAVVASKKAPATKHVTDLLCDMTRVYGAPRYVVTDRGAQFGPTYAAWCKAHGVRVRYGAIGRKGSIAIIERFIRSLKEEAFGRGRWTALPEAWMRDALDAYRVWYNLHRPHQGLGGLTPAEVCTGQERDARRFEPRRRRADPGGALRAPPGTALTAAVHAFRGRKHLPVVEIRTARTAA